MRLALFRRGRIDPADLPPVSAASVPGPMQSGLTAAEVAAHDQAEALVRELAAGGMPVMVIGHLGHGTQCVWCDCPADAGPDRPCTGCTEPAETVLSISAAPPSCGSWPVCQRHYHDAFHIVQLRLIAALRSG